MGLKFLSGSGGGGGGGGGDVMVVDHGDGTVDVTVAGGGGFSLTDNGDGTVDLTLDGDTVTLGGSGPAGRGITSIARTSGTGAPGTTDTFTITYSDSTTSTFTVYNGADGTGGGSSLTVQDEGSSLTTAATTLNFTGAGVTASGTGAAKTINIPGGGGSVAADTIFDAKGDLPVGTGADTAARLPVGTDGYAIVADSTQATGLKWVPRTRIADEVHDDSPVVTNTITETTVASLNLPTSLATGDVARFHVWADQMQNSGGNLSFRYRIKIGATTVLDTAPITITTSAARGKTAITVDVLIASPTSQRVRGVLSALRAADTWAASSAMASATGYGTAAEDLTAGKTISLTVQMGAASTLADFVCHGAALEIVKKA